ncbi:MAG: Zn-ribbon domain-containing OB-fold protein [Thermoflexales bacterium]|nr:Zn-ribbon domain-containing OB-fold protein [Thermoflexales bacterium]
MDAYVYPSVYLSQKDLDSRRVLTERWTPNARYSWDAGVAIGRYLEELRAGRLVGRRCDKCRRVLIPPRMVCEACFRPTGDWVVLQDSGTVKTFSVCYVTWDMKRLQKPNIPAVIDIDGASRGCGIMHLLGEVEPEGVKIGLRVQAVWKPAAERQGAITDILYFKPL